MIKSRRRRTSDSKPFDWAFFIGAVLLACFGVVNLYSATSVSKGALTEVYLQQVYWFVVGAILASIVTVLDYRYLERFGYIVYGGGMTLLVAVFAFGRDIRGSARWIHLGGASFQPSELTKLCLIIAIAKALHHDPPPQDGRRLTDLWRPAVLALIPFVLIYKQPDLGTALIHMFIFSSICLMTAVRWQSLATLVASVSVAIPVLWFTVLHDYQKQRVLTFLDPEANLSGAGWHAHHARIAIGNGGPLGQGFMRGTQNQYLFLPEQHSDFPFAVFAEDWGFVGGTVLVALYTFLVLWCLHVASNAKERFGAVLAVGVGALVFWHAFFNLGMVTGILPVVGITLPLFSAGGSSVMTILMGLGLVMNVSIRRHGRIT